ncbi:MAG: hotdog fold domain-containing protein [Polyangiaceae bacterium]
MDVNQLNLMSAWKRLKHLPAYDRLAGLLVGFAVPYTGTIRPRILKLEPGFSRVSLHDRRGVRNHLSSVHAVALTNLAELAASSAMMTLQPPGTRWIVTRLNIEFVKKARGTVIAECRAPEFDWTEPRDVQGHVELSNSDGECVARVEVGWRIGPVDQRSERYASAISARN